MIRPVQYARALDGKLVAVEAGPHQGWALGDVVYATESEARAADGRRAQIAYIEGQSDEICYGLHCMVDNASPFALWRNDYDANERERDLVKEMAEQLFPKWGQRSEGVTRFVAAFLLANAVYEDMRP